MNPSLAPAAQQALELFSQCSSWEARARLLMQWGDRLTPLSDAERCAANQIEGCESRVWLVMDRQSDNYQFRASSEARLLRGLLALLLVRIEGLAPQTLASLDLSDWFSQLGLSRQLSPSRSNGLFAVLQRIRQLAQDCENTSP